MTNKCKICGGQITVDSQNGIAICEYCGTKQVLPLFTKDSERLLYESGNNYLLHSEYDKAENVFNQLLTIKPSAAELYWDLVLCKYGVTYVKDPKTGKYIPTCNRTHYTPIFSDQNYQKAIELSSGEKKAIFEEDAKTIHNIQKGILAVSKKEKPFDIFISYKETDASGNRTMDSVEAQKLYEKLTEAGYKVFFSRITLEDKIGTQYEPYIYAALHSSKVMLTVSTCKEHLEAVWVKNEWSRFLLLRQSNSAKILLPLYVNMSKEDLPEEFALLSAYDMSVNGFDEELLRGIKKLIPLPVMQAKRRKQIAKVAGLTFASVAVVAGIVAAIKIPREMEEIRIAAEQAIQASKAAADEVSYQEAMRLFENGDYTAASEAFAALGNYKDSDVMVTTCAQEADYQAALTLFENAEYIAAADVFTSLGEYKDAAHMAERCAIQPDYDAAMELYYDGKYAQATWAFEALGDYEDAAIQKENAELSWRRSVASVVGRNYDEMVGSIIQEYIVNKNGSVDATESYPGKAHLGAEFNTHGNVISIAGHMDRLYALYEDGYVANSQKNTTAEQDWEAVIQLAEEFECSALALKNDGTILIEQNERGAALEEKESPLASVEQWSEIVELSRGGVVAINTRYILLGVDAHGKVHMAKHLAWFEDEGPALETFVSSLSDIKKIKAMISYDSLYVCALDNDGNVYIYDHGQKETIKGTSFKDVLCCEVYNPDTYGSEAVLLAIDEKDNLIEVEQNRTLIEDVAHISEGYVITKNGTVFRLSEITPEDTKAKTKVYDEWLID